MTDVLGIGGSGDGGGRDGALCLIPLLFVIVVWRMARSQHIQMLTNEATQPHFATSRELERTVVDFRADDIESL